MWKRPSGPVTGTATDTTAELSFGFRDNVEVFRQYFVPGCALAVTVTSFTAATLSPNMALDGSDRELPGGWSEDDDLSRKRRFADARRCRMPCP